MTHYKTTDQITETCDYEFKLPKYGPTTTDPTFYEPAATRIANMRKSASSTKTLYDFEEDSKVDVTKAHCTPGRKPGLTREEISQYQQDTSSKIKDSFENKKKEKELLEKDKRNSKEIYNALQQASEPGAAGSVDSE